MASTISRDFEAIDKVVKHAKLEPEGLLPVSQTIYFGDELLDQEEYKLIEVDKNIADMLENEESSLVFRGDDDDVAVLCTKDKTYDIKEAETSNGILLLDGLSSDKDIRDESLESRQIRSRFVVGIFHRYLELTPAKPRLNRLWEMLSNVFFNGTNIDEAGASESKLLDFVQCSQDELHKELKSIDACHFKGKFVLLDPDYKMRILSLITNFIDENSWKFEEVFKSQTLDALSEIEPRELVESVFDSFSTGKSDDINLFSLDTAKVSRFYAEYLLQSGSSFNLEEFVSMWKEAVPDGITVDVDKHLLGISLIDETKRPKTVRYFTENSLPEKVQERLEVLFRMREKWTIEEISPYVEKLTTPKLNVNALLTKYARTSKVDGKKVFGAKHGK